MPNKDYTAEAAFLFAEIYNLLQSAEIQVSLKDLPAVTARIEQFSAVIGRLNAGDLSVVEAQLDRYADIVEQEDAPDAT